MILAQLLCAHFYYTMHFPISAVFTDFPSCASLRLINHVYGFVNFICSYKKNSRFSHCNIQLSVTAETHDISIIATILYPSGSIKYVIFVS